MSRDSLRLHALNALSGVGDAQLGEWTEVGSMLPFGMNVYHLRRRLSEQEASRVDGVRDIRNTPDADRRYERMRRYLPSWWKDGAV